MKQNEDEAADFVITLILPNKFAYSFFVQLYNAKCRKNICD